MNSKPPILLVEDNPNDELLTRRALEKNAVQNPLVVAHDGVEALELLLGPNALKPSVVLLDLNLPRLGGLDVLAKLRADERTKRLPVVVLTTSREEHDLITCYDRGANSYVRKPVSYEAFQKAIGQLSEYWLVLNERPADGS